MTGKPRKPLVAERRRTLAKPKATPKKATPQKARKKPTRKQTAARKHNILVRIILWIFGKVTRLIWAIMWRGTLVFGLILAAGIMYFASTIPDLNELVDGRARGSVTLMDRNDAVFAWRGDQYGGLVTAETVSPNLKNAIIATEDKRFYRHLGISPRGIASAVRINLREGRGPLSGHGGSTLTQQTAKLLCLGVPFDPAQWKSEAAYEADCREGSLWRKVKEAVYAMGLEVKFTKDEILTIYINRAFLGAGARGFEAASQRYFGKSAAEVTPAQGAMLAGLLVAPTRYAPTSNLTRSQNRANVIIGLMEAQGYITPAQANEARWTKTFNAQQSSVFRKCSKPKYPQSPRRKPPLSSCQLTVQSVPWWEDAKPRYQARLTARHRRFAKQDQRLNQLCMAPLSNLVIRLLI